jgi:hypothetical protein
MTRNPPLFSIASLIQARVELVHEARALPRGAERNQKRQIARSLKGLTEAQSEARDYSRRVSRIEFRDRRAGPAPIPPI